MNNHTTHSIPRSRIVFSSFLLSRSFRSRSSHTASASRTVFDTRYPPPRIAPPVFRDKHRTRPCEVPPPDLGREIRGTSSDSRIGGETWNWANPRSDWDEGNVRRDLVRRLELLG
ncbi:hypothetical protein V565_193200 [Rhizoctonia solani 123E]|uniref:Uncharacterized protein n=1 Tax=Rhizoctonia solani 123E TaxID=1423351 RepID=A0A074RID1_9AGAM|nr:hypothetical protein V565_193200 [Rhizoctonia solani 123E]